MCAGESDPFIDRNEYYDGLFNISYYLFPPPSSPQRMYFLNNPFRHIFYKIAAALCHYEQILY